MRRFLLDQGLAPGAAALLRNDGWDAVHVSEIEMQTAEDVEILNVARQTDRICITLDHDFHAHLAIARSGRPSCAVASTGSRRKRSSCVGSVWYGSIAQTLLPKALPFLQTVMRSASAAYLLSKRFALLAPTLDMPMKKCGKTHLERPQ
jgi:predicted nuclease of predicted toxin-antitoxin system